MNRYLAALRVSELINEAEQAMDQALSRASRLVTELPDLQAQAGLNAAWAHPVVVAVCSALGDMTEARGSLIHAHRSLSVLQRRLGVALMEIPTNEKNPDGPARPIPNGMVPALRQLP